MTRLQRGAAYIAASLSIERDRFLQSYPAPLLDALVSKGYVAHDRGVYTVTESGHRFINDNEANDHD